MTEKAIADIYGVLWIIAGCLFHMIGAIGVAWSCWGFGSFVFLVAVMGRLAERLADR